MQRHAACRMVPRAPSHCHVFLTLQLSSLRSNKKVSTPPSASVSAAHAPEGPPPMTATRSLRSSAVPSGIPFTVCSAPRRTRDDARTGARADEVTDAPLKAGAATLAMARAGLGMGRALPAALAPPRRSTDVPGTLVKIACAMFERALARPRGAQRDATF
eukprot:365942-Chlamydomonas_euryale.AAC.39